MYEETEAKIDEISCPRIYNYKNTKHMLNVICCNMLKDFYVTHLVKVLEVKGTWLREKGNKCSCKNR